MRRLFARGFDVTFLALYWFDTDPPIPLNRGVERMMRPGWCWAVPKGQARRVAPFFR